MWQKQPSARKDNPIYSKKGQIIKKTSGLNYQYPFTVDPYLLEKYKEYIINNNLIPPPRPVTPPVPPPLIQRVQVFKSQAIITIPSKNNSSSVTTETILSLIQTYDENISSIFNNYSNFYLIYDINKSIRLYEEQDDIESNRRIQKYLGQIIIYKTENDVNISLGFVNNIIYFNDAFAKTGINTFQYFRSNILGSIELINGNTDITFILLP